MKAVILVVSGFALGWLVNEFSFSLVAIFEKQEIEKLKNNIVVQEQSFVGEENMFSEILLSGTIATTKRMRPELSPMVENKMFKKYVKEKHSKFFSSLEEGHANIRKIKFNNFTFQELQKYKTHLDSEYYKKLKDNSEMVTNATKEYYDKTRGDLQSLVEKEATELAKDRVQQIEK